MIKKQSGMNRKLMAKSEKKNVSGLKDLMRNPSKPDYVVLNFRAGTFPGE